jgi:hypothetical protein
VYMRLTTRDEQASLTSIGTRHMAQPPEVTTTWPWPPTTSATPCTGMPPNTSDVVWFWVGPPTPFRNHRRAGLTAPEKRLDDQ